MKSLTTNKIKQNIMKIIIRNKPHLSSQKAPNSPNDSGRRIWYPTLFHTLLSSTFPWTLWAQIWPCGLGPALKWSPSTNWWRSKDRTNTYGLRIVFCKYSGNNNKWAKHRFYDGYTNLWLDLLRILHVNILRISVMKIDGNILQLTINCSHK